MNIAHPRPNDKAQASKNSPATPRDDGWIVRVRLTPELLALSPPCLKMLLVLEDCCRTKSFCWHSNTALATKGKWSVVRVKEILRDLATQGYVFLAAAEPGKNGSHRAGIFLRKRLDPDQPIEDREPSPDAIQRLWNARGRSCQPDGKASGRRGENARQPDGKASGNRMEKHPVDRMENHPQNKDGFLKEDEKNDDDKTGPSSSDSSSTQEDGGKAIQTAQDRPGRDSSPDPDPKAEEPADRPGEDLGPLVAEAQRRFECDESDVRGAVAKYPREWVEAVVWGEPRTEGWGGVVFLLKTWKADGKPNQKAVEAARAAMEDARRDEERLAKYGPDDFLPGETVRFTGETLEQRKARIEGFRRFKSRTPAETFRDELRWSGYTIAPSPEGPLVVVAPPLVFEAGETEWSKRLAKMRAEDRTKRIAELQEWLDGLQSEVNALLETSPAEAWSEMVDPERKIYGDWQSHVRGREEERRNRARVRAALNPNTAAELVAAT